MGSVREQLRAVPANEVPWGDLQAVLAGGQPGRCQCQRYTIGNVDWTPEPVEVRAARLQEQARCGEPDAAATAGLVGYLGAEPVGWCSVQPRTAYPLLRTSRSPVYWRGRDEDPDDPGVWALTCLVTRPGHRRQGVSAALVAAAVPFARERGARALEGYPMRTDGKDVTWGELFVGSAGSFADAGFREVSRPTLRRVVMRVDV